MLLFGLLHIRYIFGDRQLSTVILTPAIDNPNPRHNQTMIGPTGSPNNLSKPTHADHPTSIRTLSPKNPRILATPPTVHTSCPLLDLSMLEHLDC